MTPLGEADPPTPTGRLPVSTRAAWLVVAAAVAVIFILTVRGHAAAGR